MANLSSQFISNTFPSEFLFNRKCQIITRTKSTQPNGTTKTTENGPGPEIPCGFQVDSSDEGILFQKQTSTVRHLLLLNGVVDISGDDIVLIDGIRYRVKGPATDKSDRGVITNARLERDI